MNKPPLVYTLSPNTTSGPTRGVLLSELAASFLLSYSPVMLMLILATVLSSKNPYAFLTTFDTIFLIDDSGFIAGRN
jgi:hypothetical protein